MSRLGPHQEPQLLIRPRAAVQWRHCRAALSPTAMTKTSSLSAMPGAWRYDALNFEMEHVMGSGSCE